MRFHHADTLYGVTYVVLAPENELVDKITTAECMAAVEQYKEFARKQTEIERLSTVREKTGVFTGAYAVNPVNGEKVPIWIADYVLAGYGTGCVMAVPAHDERDYLFAEKYNLPIRRNKGLRAWMTRFLSWKTGSLLKCEFRKRFEEQGR